MPSLSASNLSVRQTLLLTALTASLATTAAILSFQALRREHRTERLKKQVGQDVSEWEKENGQDEEDDLEGLTSEEKAERWAEGNMGSGPSTGRTRNWEEGEFDEGLIREQLTRNYNFLGEESMAKIRKSYVVVVGCGGVGSWAALMLLRSGVGHLLLIDFDMTTLSSLNRHAAATLEDVGSPKVVATQKYLKKIAPWAKVDIHVGLWKKNKTSEDLLAGADWVIDAIDNIDTKADLLTYCRKSDIPVFSSMGSGAKMDPTRVQIADLSTTNEDPLARKVRHRLRLNGISGGIPTVYSTETPSDIKLLPLPEEEFAKGPVSELTPFDDFRVRILPVLGPLPAIFGLNIATYIILSLAGRPLTEYAEVKNRKKTHAELERKLSEREARVKGNVHQERIGVDSNDLAFIFEDLYNGRSALPPHIVVPRPTAVRWDIKKELTVDNVVIMDLKSAERHERECLKEGKSMEEVWGKEAVDSVAKRSAEARRAMEYRRN